MNTESSNPAHSILVVGSLAYDSISTPAGAVQRTLGGSANYFSLAASLFAPVQVVGVVGSDYSEKDRALLESRKVDLTGLQVQTGKTFHWEGRYSGDMNEAETLKTELNVFGDFKPELPKSYQKAGFVFLANIDPALQLAVLEQVEKPVLVGADTMNFWISSKRETLLKVLSKVDVLLINEGEAEMLTSKSNAIAASDQLIQMGPKAVVVKRGEYGFVLRTKEGYFMLPAFPVAQVVDPTGAGDTFAGAFFGTIASVAANEGQSASQSLVTLKQACVNGAVLASYTVEAFGVGRLVELDHSRLKARQDEFMRYTSR